MSNSLRSDDNIWRSKHILQVCLSFKIKIRGLPALLVSSAQAIAQHGLYHSDFDENYPKHFPIYIALYSGLIE